MPTTAPLPKNEAAIGIESRRERQRQEARSAILDATQVLLSESEDGDFSIRSLAARCGYSAPTIYHYFGDKDGLLAELFSGGMRALAIELEEACQSKDSLDRLRSILLAFIRFATDHATFSSLWATVARQPGSEMPEAYGDVKELLDAPIRELIEAGRFGDFDTASAEQVLWAMLHGLIALPITEPDHPWAPGLAENAVDSLLRGMTF
ncbi:MAG: TetR/AcrR family transcriptional regulator, partial [Myxococcota bacterium]